MLRICTSDFILDPKLPFTLRLSLFGTQINVLETMSPLDFLSFRDALYPASGFQSTQFRLLENKLGLTPSRRLAYGSRPYCTYLSGGDADVVSAAETEPSLLLLVQGWLGEQLSCWLGLSLLF